ncbi:MAG: hypothetical protein GXO87_01870, partial [Chlorobi bacterium]|nr:hypothetical protein [Chlorobiota bacterium]
MKKTYFAILIVSALFLAQSSVAQIQFGVGAGYTTLSSSTSYTEPIEDGGTG